MKKGFTLVELLVVISIIGLLASIVLVSLNSARAKARDARRKADLNQIQLALGLYFDKNGGYPGEAGWCDSSKGVIAVSCAGFIGNNWPAGGLIDVEAQGFIILPFDPINSEDFYYYYEPVVSQTQFGVTCGAEACAYKIGAKLETSSDPACMVSLNYCVAGGGAQ